MCLTSYLGMTDIFHTIHQYWHKHDPPVNIKSDIGILIYPNELLKLIQVIIIYFIVSSDTITCTKYLVVIIQKEHDKDVEGRNSASATKQQHWLLTVMTNTEGTR